MQQVPDLVLDASLDKIAESDLMVVCSDEPTTYEEATVTYKLAEVGMSAGSYAKADDVSGRKLTIGMVSTVPILENGDATHVALLKVSDESIRLITTCALQPLTSGGTLDIQSWKYNLQDPAGAV